MCLKKNDLIDAFESYNVSGRISKSTTLSLSCLSWIDTAILDLDLGQFSPLVQKWK